MIRALEGFGDDAASRTIQKTQRDILNAYNLVLRKMQERAMELYKSINGRATDPETIFKLKRYRDFTRWLQYQFSTLSGAQSTRLYKGVSKAYKEAYRDETEKIEKIINMKLEGVPTAERINFSLQNPITGEPLSSILERNRIIGQYDLARDFGLAVRRGLSPGAVLDALQTSLEKQAGKMIRTLHTEGNRIVNESVQGVFSMAVDFAGDTIEKYWIHHPGPKGGSRYDHVAMHGRVADPDGLFTLPNGHRGAGPGQFGYPEDDINCYCRMSIRKKEGAQVTTWYQDERPLSVSVTKPKQPTNRYLEAVQTDYIAHFPDSSCDELKQALSEAPRSMLRLIKKYGKAPKIVKRDDAIAFYEPDTDVIEINTDYDRSENPRGAFVQRLHETFHMIDYRAGKGESVLAQDRHFLKLLHNDFKALEKKVKGNLQSKRGSEPSFDELREALVEMLIGPDKSSVSDIIGGLTKGRFQGRYGHALWYWRIPGTVQAEASAHMFAASMLKNTSGAKQFAAIRNMFPTAYRYFLRKVNRL